jgi:Fur family ferric uptake transcriptional regulator
MLDTETFKNILKTSGYNFTQPRLSVFKIIRDNDPLSISEIIKLIDNRIDRVSVYRIIDIFEKINIIQRVNIGWKYKIELSDQFVDHHHHLICIKCGKIIQMNETGLESFLEKISKQNNFRTQSHQIEIQGYCSNCK